MTNRPIDHCIGFATRQRFFFSSLRGPYVERGVAGVVPLLMEVAEVLTWHPAFMMANIWLILVNDVS